MAAAPTTAGLVHSTLADERSDNAIRFPSRQVGCSRKLPCEGVLSKRLAAAAPADHGYVGVPHNGFRCVCLTASANDGSMQCPVCSSPIVITIAAAALDELDRRVCRSCRWSAYVDGSAHGSGYLRRSSP